MESISGGALYHLTSRQEVVEELVDLAFGPFQVIRVFYHSRVRRTVFAAVISIFFSIVIERVHFFLVQPCVEICPGEEQDEGQQNTCDGR